MDENEEYISEEEFQAQLDATGMKYLDVEFVPRDDGMADVVDPDGYVLARVPLGEDGESVLIDEEDFKNMLAVHLGIDKEAWKFNFAPGFHESMDELEKEGE